MKGLSVVVGVLLVFLAAAPWLWMFAVWPVMYSFLGWPISPLAEGVSPAAVFLWPLWTMALGGFGFALADAAS